MRGGRQTGGPWSSPRGQAASQAACLRTARGARDAQIEIKNNTTFPTEQSWVLVGVEQAPGFRAVGPGPGSWHPGGQRLPLRGVGEAETRETACPLESGGLCGNHRGCAGLYGKKAKIKGKQVTFPAEGSGLLSCNPGGWRSGGGLRPTAPHQASAPRPGFPSGPLPSLPRSCPWLPAPDTEMPLARASPPRCSEGRRPRGHSWGAQAGDRTERL